MFQNIPEVIFQRMRQLEAIDRRDRTDGTAHLKRLRQVPPSTARFVAMMAALSPPGTMLEIGTSAGYSTLWLGLACQHLGRRLTSYEVLPDKAALARETVKLAGMEATIELVMGDGLDGLRAAEQVGFCFLDADKDRSMGYLEAVVPRLVPGGLFVVDNAISHADRMEDMIAAAQASPNLDAMVVPIGKGVLLCRYQEGPPGDPS